MIRKNRIPFDLIVIGSVAILSAVVSMVGLDIPWVRTVAALPLLLILPGLAIQLALFPKRLFGNAEQFILIVGTSIMLDAVLGVVLNAIGVKLQSGSWAVILTSIVLIACYVAGVGRQRLDIDSSFTFAIDLNWVQILIVGLAVILIGGAVSLIDLPLPQPKIDQGYTILWIQPDQNKSNIIHVGAISNEFAPTSYSLSLVADDQVLYQWNNIKLAPGQKWETQYETLPALSNSTRVEALLYKQDSPDTAYRRVWLYSGSKGEPTHGP